VGVRLEALGSDGAWTAEPDNQAMIEAVSGDERRWADVGTTSVGRAMVRGGIGPGTGTAAAATAVEYPSNII
jgi:hypothetical protein